MIEVLLWLLVVLLSLVCFYFIVKTFVFAHSLSNDAPYVPVSREVAKQALEFLKLKEGDNFVDIGSGDGSVVFQAANVLKGKGSFTGVEISGLLIFWSKVRQIFNLYRKSISFVKGDMFEQDYFKYNKVVLFLTEDLLKKLILKLEYELPKGARVVSVLFKFPDEFMKANKVETKTCRMWGKECNLYLWTKK